MLAVKRSAGIVPEVNVREHTSHTHPSSVNKAAHSGFKTQEMSPEVQNRSIIGPIKGHVSTKNLKRFPLETQLLVVSRCLLKLNI